MQVQMQQNQWYHGFSKFLSGRASKARVQQQSCAGTQRLTLNQLVADVLEPAKQVHASGEAGRIKGDRSTFQTSKSVGALVSGRGQWPCMQKVTSPTRAASEMKVTYGEMRKLITKLLKIAGIIIVPNIGRGPVRRKRNRHPGLWVWR